MSLFGKILKAGTGLAKGIVKNPLLKMVPGVGNVLSVASIGLSAYDMLKGSGGASSAPGGGGMPALPMMAGSTAVRSAGGAGLPMNPMAGQRSIFKNDPNVIAAIKPYVISAGNLRTFHRAPKGYVIMKDEVGDPMGVPKFLARRMGWKPAKKPLLSVRDTQAIRHAGVAIKKLQKAEKMARHIANWHSPHRAATRNIVVTGHTVGKKRAA